MAGMPASSQALQLKLAAGSFEEAKTFCELLPNPDFRVFSYFYLIINSFLKNGEICDRIISRFPEFTAFGESLRRQDLQVSVLEASSLEQHVGLISFFQPIVGIKINCVHLRII